MFISVCLCTYNGEKYISEQLESLMRQTRRPDQIVVCDDCSSDDTFSIVKKYSKIYSDIKWTLYRNDINRGWRESYTNALSKCFGDIVFLCDQDDIWNRKKIEVMADVLEHNARIDVLVSNPTVYLEEKSKYLKKKETFKLKNITNKKHSCNVMFPGCTFAVRNYILPLYFNCWKPEQAHDALLYKLAFYKGSLYHLSFNSIIWRRTGKNATSRSCRPFTYSDYSERKKTLKIWRSYLDSIYALNNELNMSKTLKHAEKFQRIRERLYQKKSLLSFFRLFWYLSFYRSLKSYILDFESLIFGEK